jgi:hypothetical protein
MVHSKAACAGLLTFVEQWRAPRWVFGSEFGRVIEGVPMGDAISGIGLVVFGTIAVAALCIGVCALAMRLLGSWHDGSRDLSRRDAHSPSPSWPRSMASRGARRRNRSGNSIVGIARGTSNKLTAHRGFSSRKPSVQNCSPRWLANTNHIDRSRRLEGNMELTFNRGVSHWSGVPSS